MDRSTVEGRTAVVVYVPVLHEGYLNLFRRFVTADRFCIIGTQLIGQFDYLRKEIRAIQPSDALTALRSLFRCQRIDIVCPTELRELARQRYQIVMPDDDVSHTLAAEYLSSCQIRFDSAFLRWHRKNVQNEVPVNPDLTISKTERDRELMQMAFREAEKSSDWWRHVGAVLVRDGQVLFVAHNRHLPTDYTPYVDGDPRNVHCKGVNIELGTVLHAEKAIICKAACSGTSIQGAWLYVTTFPCPPCAKAVAASGIVRVCFAEGYAMLDGERVLRDAGILIVRVR